MAELKIVYPSPNYYLVAGADNKIQWTFDPTTDPSAFSVYLNNPKIPDLSDFAIANTVNTTLGVTTVQIPPSLVNTGFVIRFTNVANIADIYTTSEQFEIKAPGTTPTTYVAPVPTTSAVATTNTDTAATTSPSSSSTNAPKSNSESLFDNSNFGLLIITITKIFKGTFNVKVGLAGGLGFNSVLTFLVNNITSTSSSNSSTVLLICLPVIRAMDWFKGDNLITLSPESN
nr:5605_t:CDS:2 [Entrophospora candida]